MITINGTIINELNMLFLDIQNLTFTTAKNIDVDIQNVTFMTAIMSRMFIFYVFVLCMEISSDCDVIYIIH